MPDATPTQEALDAAIDEVLLDIIANGRIVQDKDGQPVLGADGKPMRERPSAADLNAAINRLKYLGIDKRVTPDTAAYELARQCGLENPNTLKFPDISDLDDPKEAAI